MCEWSDTHRHIHPEIHKNITKIIVDRNMLGDDVNQDIPDMSLI